MEIFRRIWYLIHRRQIEREMRREMAYHREMIARERGRTFGSELRWQEDARDVWGWSWLDRLCQDLAYGVRVLRKSPGFTITATLVLGLGIGVTLTAVRGLLEAISPTVPDPDTLVHLERAAKGSHSTAVSYRQFEFYARNARSFRSMIAEHRETVTFGDTAPDQDPETVTINFVTASYCAEMGIQALHGRLLSVQDEAPGAEAVALLQQHFWERRLGSDVGVIGRRIRLNGKSVMVAGVVRAGPNARSAVWMPLARQPYVIDGSNLLKDWGDLRITMSGRLKPGVSPRASESETGAIAARLHEEQPDSAWSGEYLEARPYSSIEDVRDVGIAVAAASLILLVLIVACANLGTLLLARGVAREREIRTRMALGADRWRVVRQLLTEALLLASVGGAAALILSSAVLKMMRTNPDVQEGLSTLPDWRIICATVVIALVCAAIFGLAPTLRITSTAPRSGSGRTVFLTMQVGASCVLLIISSMLVRSLKRLISVDPGFDYRHVLVLNPDLHSHGYSGDAAQQYFDLLRQRLRAIPGVEQASVVRLAPWGNVISGWATRGRNVMINSVDPEFVATLRLHLTRGRTFRHGERGAALVSESFARWQWPGEDALGKKVPLDDPAVVIGVVKTAGTFNLRQEDPLGIYLALTDASEAVLVVRVAGRPAGYGATLQAAASEPDGRLRPGVVVLRSRFEEILKENRSLTSIVGALGILATALAALGLAGLTAFTVSQRTREIGIRTSLGAGGPQIVRAILSSMVRPAVGGFILGSAGAAGVSSLLRHDIFGLRPLDPAAYLAAIVLFVAVMALATAAPVRRALRIDPSVALRHE